MQHVRRKSIDPKARTYLMKAKTEGIRLSWDLFENMLPQDGFAQLGLTCQDCLQGPCRLNPFRPEEQYAICGFDRDELVYRGFVKKLTSESYNPKEIYSYALADVSTPEQKVKNLEKLALRQMEQKKLRTESVERPYDEKSGSVRQMGLGVLKTGAVNICLQAPQSQVKAWAQELAEELRDEAVRQGAREGFNPCLIGDVACELDTVTNEAHFEFALLTGLVDFVVMGQAPVKGRQLIKAYQISWVTGIETKEQFKSIFRQALSAFKQRVTDKILPSSTFEGGYVGAALSPEELSQKLEKGFVEGICLLGGGSNLRVTADEGTIQVARTLVGKKVLGVSYGNTAVTLGQNGYLVHEGAGFYAFEDQGISVLERIRELPGGLKAKTIAVFPEMNTSEDLQMAFSLAASGIKVLSGIKLPIEGSKIFADLIQQKIEYCPIGELAERLGQFFQMIPEYPLMTGSEQQVQGL